MSENRFISVHEMLLMNQSSGYDLTLKKERLRSVKELEDLFFRILNYVKPDIFIEAGAKDAETSERARKYLPESKITAFEANPHTYSEFHAHERIKNSDINYIHSALSERVGTLTFSLRSEVDGVKKSNTDGTGSILAPSIENVKLEKHTVNATTLDHYFDEERFTNAFVWMDVEGATKEVLSGATEFLKKAAVGVFIEVEDRKYWENQWISKDVINFMMNRNFIPVARDFQSRYQYNVLFLHEDVVAIDYVRFSIQMHLSKANNKKI